MEDRQSKPEPLGAGNETPMRHNHNPYPAEPAEALLRELRMDKINLEKQNAELRKAQADMKESRDHYASLYDNSPVGYLTLNRNGTIDEINLTCAELLGVVRDKLIHCSLARFIAAEEWDRWLDVFLGALRHEGRRSFEMTMQRNDGSFFEAWLDYMQMPSANGALQVRVSLTDITEWKSLEKKSDERRKEMNELQKLHIAAQTASAIAHELNQPLLAIASYSKAALLMLKAEKPDYDNVCSAIEGSERQAHRAGQSLRELFDFLNSNEFTIEDFDLIQELILILNDARKEHELHFHSALRLERVPFVRANRTHIQKALFNLLHNAIEAMHEFGVLLPAITVTVGRAKAGNAAQVTVHDNGPGVGKADTQRLFEPFYTTKPDGFGMGLAISRSLIEENGGKLWFEPREGTGAIFHLTVPFAS